MMAAHLFPPLDDKADGPRSSDNRVKRAERKAEVYFCGYLIHLRVLLVRLCGLHFFQKIEER